MHILGRVLCGSMDALPSNIRNGAEKYIGIDDNRKICSLQSFEES